MALSRREFLMSMAGTMLAAGTLWPAASALAKEWSLEDFTKNIQSGGPPKDGIPPIDRPKYIAANEAGRFLQATDIVFGLDHGGTVKAYPQKILVWHEIVNDEFDGGKISVTYCPLTGSAVGFSGRSLDGTMLSFGTSGKLVNSNLVMYDRQTDSQWPQILGIGIDGKSKGTVLEETTLDWTTWSRWRAQHPETRVLSTDTGYFRSYGRDPYGSYDQSGTYYDSGGPLFPLMAKDDRFGSKEVVLGVKANGRRMAIHKESLRQKQVINTNLSSLPLIAIYDRELDVGRVFIREIRGKPSTFVSDGNRILDKLTHSEWTAGGRASAGKLEGSRLRQHPSYDVMWFAWYAFFPETEVVT